MKITDTLILEDRMSQTIKAVQTALDHAAASTKIAQTEMEMMKKAYGDTSIEAAKATLAWSKHAQQTINLENKLNKLKEQEEKVNKELEKTEQLSKKAQTGMFALGSAIGTIGANLLMQAGQMLKNSIGQAIETASDLVEVQNVVDVAFGNSAETINKWSRTALTQYGLNELSAKQFAGTMGAMLKSSGLAGEAVVKMSTDIAGLAGDMASFYNLDPSEAFMKLRSGISGETEPLKQLGINMSVANLEAYALSQGITKAYSKMSQAEQTTLRYNYLMKATADAQGDFSRTSNTFANQQRLLTENWKRFSSAIANGALPALTNLFVILNKVLNFAVDNIPKLMQMIQTASIFIGTAITMIIPYFIALKAQAISTFFVMRVEAIKTALATAGAWMVANAPILIALSIIGAVSLALKAMGISFNQQAQNIVTSFFMIGNVIQNIGILVANFFRSIFNGIINTINLVRKLKGETPLDGKKQYTAFKNVYLDSVASTNKLSGKTKGITQQFNVGSGINKALDKVTDGGALKTKQQGKIELQEEDIELLSQLATRDWTIRSQTLAPNIQFGAVTVNENADIGQFINELNNSVAEMANNNLNVGVGK